MTGPDVAAQVLELAHARPPTLGRGRLVCVDGPAGSGKTTLASALALLDPRAVVVHMDDLYAGWDGLPGVADQLDGLLRPLAAGRPGSYRRWDWHAGRFAETVEVAPTDLLVLEGVGAGSGSVADLATVLVWVDAPHEARMRRGLERDGEAFAPHWEAWAAAEEAHFGAEGTRERADLRLDGSAPAPLPPTGAQHRIAHDAYAAVVTETGATLRSLTHDGQPLVDEFGEDELPGKARGQLLVPWPNRVRDGRWSFGGRDHQLALSEPDRANAMHGLVRWGSWWPGARGPASVTLHHRLPAQRGYPWMLDLAVTYALGTDGLTTTLAATNRSAAPAPYAAGAHPYFRVGDGLVDRLSLRLPARTRALLDDRMIPVGREPVAGTAYDLTAGRVIGDLALDDAFTDLVRDGHGRATAELRDPSTGAGVALWVDEHHRWLQVFTADDHGERARHHVAVEPMTAPGDALRTGDDLVVIDPGATFTVQWGVRALPPRGS